MRERKPVLDLDREIIGYFANTFIPRFDRYPLQRRDGSYVAVNDLLTFDRIANHLLGWHTLGAYTLDTDSQARWLCLDADDQPTWQGLISLARDLAADFVPAYLGLSRRGGHLWLFTAPTPGREIRRFGKQLLHEHGLEQVELYANEQKGLDAIAPVKLFTPDANWTWYASEYDAKDTLFGLVSGFEVEMGYFSLTEPEGVRGALGLPIERDLHYKPTTLRELQQLHQQFD